jgi:putative DNA-invertase from lambdoid prophage Rac
VTTSAVAYFRVSKKDGSQTTTNQQPEVLTLARARGFNVVATYEDKESGVKRRPGLERMLAALRCGKHGPTSIVIVWSLDRLGRGLAGSFDQYRNLAHLGVRVVSVREPWLDVDGPARELLVAILSWVSGYEREHLILRTKAGLERARREGKRLGRPAAQLAPADLKKALELKAAGWGSRRIVGELQARCAASTLDKLLAPYCSGPRKGHQKPSTELAETMPEQAPANTGP